MMRDLLSAMLAGVVLSGGPVWADANGKAGKAGANPKRQEMMMQKLAQAFQKGDADGNGALTATEFAVALQAMREQGGPDRKGGPQGKKPEGKGDAKKFAGKGGDGKAGEMAARMFTRFDANGDSAVTREEFGNGLRAMMQQRGEGKGPPTKNAKNN